jgi:uncharacterized protein with HEPN domain
MKHPEDSLYLQHILDAIADIQKFTASAMEEDMKAAAIERKLEIAGEAVKRLSLSLRESHPQVPWKKIAGLRDS